jgi:hypothetical protein
MIDNVRLLRRIEDMLGARNDAHDAQQRFWDAHVATEPDATSDALAEATSALIDRIDNVIMSVEWQNLMLGIDAE